MFVPLLAAAPIYAQVKVTQGDGRILVDVGGQPFTALFVGVDTPKPYLHPLRSASGKIVTRSYPMENVEGEKRDHPHHRGLWFTHGDVNGTDFWGNEPSQRGVGGKKGRVVLQKVTQLKSGEKSGSLAATFDWVDSDGKRLLSEARTIAFESHPTLRTMDFDIQLTAAENVTFGDTKEGTFAIRLVRALEEEQTGRMINAAGAAGEKAVWGKASPWVDYSGVLDGEKLGIAILDHPSNPKHPTYWHSRAYGLFAANIFGERDFFRDKTRNGGVTLAPGGKLRFRYRVVIHPGDTQAAGIDDLYKKYEAVK